MTDYRKARTDAAIRSAFIELSKTVPFDKISVAGIAKKALINRQTFYRHYPDKIALLEEINDDFLSYYEGLLTSRFDHMRDPASRRASDFEWFGKLIENSLDHRDEYLLLKHTKLPQTTFADEQIALIKRIYRKKKPQASELETLLFATMAQALNDYCLEGNCTVNPTEVVTALSAIANLRP